jgi:hypothetical protein
MIRTARPTLAEVPLADLSLPNLLGYFRQRITNSRRKGFNSVIQVLKCASRGFRSFDNYGTRIRFFCGKLDLRPRLPCH